MNRRKSREEAMKLLYEMSINKENSEKTLNAFRENNDRNNSDIDMSYIEKVINGVEHYKDEIDKKISDNLTNWKIDRISKVSLAILRISTYEIMYEADIPEAVSINEGIELAKKYSEDDLGSFTNGVLGNMVKKQK